MKLADSRVLERTLNGRVRSTQSVGRNTDVEQQPSGQVQHGGTFHSALFHAIEGVIGSSNIAAVNKKRTVLLSYQRKANKLEHLRQETEAFFRTMITSSFMFDLDSKSGQEVEELAKEAMSKHFEDLLSFRFSRPASKKSLRFLAKAPAEIAQELSTHLKNSIEEFIAEFLRQMDRMSHIGIPGSIRFSGTHSDNCEFDYFRVKLVSKHTATHAEKLSELSRGAPYLVDGTWKCKAKSVYEALKIGVFKIQHVSHIHLLSDVTRIPLRSWTLPLPLRTKNVAAAIPSFLKDASYFATGTVQRIRIIARDVKDVSWEYASIETREEEVIHVDPALVIGTWVVSGFCNKEQPRVSVMRRIGAFVVHWCTKSRNV